MVYMITRPSRDVCVSSLLIYRNESSYHLIARLARTYQKITRWHVTYYSPYRLICQAELDYQPRRCRSPRLHAGVVKSMVFAFANVLKLKAATAAGCYGAIVPDYILDMRIADNSFPDGI